jgi:hypothetical protein
MAFNFMQTVVAAIVMSYNSDTRKIALAIGYGERRYGVLARALSCILHFWLSRVLRGLLISGECNGPAPRYWLLLAAPEQAIYQDFCQRLMGLWKSDFWSRIPWIHEASLDIEVKVQVEIHRWSSGETSASISKVYRSGTSAVYHITGWVTFPSHAAFLPQGTFSRPSANSRKQEHAEASKYPCLKERSLPGNHVSLEEVFLHTIWILTSICRRFRLNSPCPRPPSLTHPFRRRDQGLMFFSKVEVALQERASTYPAWDRHLSPQRRALLLFVHLPVSSSACRRKQREKDSRGSISYKYRVMPILSTAFYIQTSSHWLYSPNFSPMSAVDSITASRPELQPSSLRIRKGRSMLSENCHSILYLNSFVIFLVPNFQMIMYLTWFPTPRVLTVVHAMP